MVQSAMFAPLCQQCGLTVQPGQPHRATAQVDLDPNSGRAYSTPPVYSHLACLNLGRAPREGDPAATTKSP